LEGLLKSSLRLPVVKRLLPRNGLGAGWKADVWLVGSAEMTGLNHKYRRINRPTDVLSFQSPDVIARQGYLGEVVICLPVARKQAKEYCHSLNDELCVLIAHGLLHLLGLDHEKGPKDAARMAKLEAKLLKANSGLIRRQH
jgi:probable rRNA maturation factor